VNRFQIRLFRIYSPFEIRNQHLESTTAKFFLGCPTQRGGISAENLDSQLLIILRVIDFPKELRSKLLTQNPTYFKPRNKKKVYFDNLVCNVLD
jgi:hypothetical protein